MFKYVIFSRHSYVTIKTRNHLNLLLGNSAQISKFLRICGRPQYSLDQLPVCKRQLFTNALPLRCVRPIIVSRNRNSCRRTHHINYSHPKQQIIKLNIKVIYNITIPNNSTIERIKKYQ